MRITPTIHHLFALTLAAVLVSVAATVAAAQCDDYVDGAPWIGGVTTPDAALGTAIGGNHAYVAAHASGLQVVDIADPTAPRIVGAVPGPDFYDVAIAGNYAVVADWSHGIKVVDITDAADPRVVAELPTPGSPTDVTVAGDYAYVLEVGAEPGIRVVDISNPLEPDYAGWLGMPAYPYDVAVSGGYAYVANAMDGLQVVDIADPLSPQLVCIVDTPGGADGVAVAGGYAYVADRMTGLQVVDITDPRNAAIVGSVATPDWARGVAVSGDYAYIAEKNLDSALRVLDISDPTSPYVVGGMPTPGTVYGLAIAGSNVYVADGPAGLQIASLQCEAALACRLDIRPGSCPNPLDVTVPKGEKAKGGVLPVAILGSDELDVRDIDVSSLELESATPLGHNYQDIAAPPAGEDDCACSDAGPDGYTDLSLKFARLEVVAGLGNVSGDGVPVRLTGRMKDGTAIELVDCVDIVPRKGEGGPQRTWSDEPEVTALGHAVPNPFNPTTEISYELGGHGLATLKVYDVRGRLVDTLVQAELPAGRYTATWNANGIASGVYFYRLTVGSFSEARRMVLLK